MTSGASRTNGHDHSCVVHEALLDTGEVAVVTRTTLAELSHLARSRSLFVPRYARQLEVIEDVVDVHTRINIRGALAAIRRGQRGLLAMDR